MPYLHARFYGRERPFLGGTGHFRMISSRPISRLIRYHRLFISDEWAENNCCQCEFRDVSKEVIARMKGNPIEINCLLEETVKSVNGQCVPGKAIQLPGLGYSASGT